MPNDYIDGYIINGTEYDFVDSTAREEAEGLIENIATVAETKQYLDID